MCSARRAAPALLVLAVLAPAAAAQTIDTIVVVRQDIFGPASGAPPLIARIGDGLHVRTAERTIRRALHLDPGMPYDSARVAEAERGLRAMAIFRDVRIDTARIDAQGGARFGVVVRTADGWSTKPQVEYRTTAGDVTWQLGLVEENLLGTATLFAAVYGRTPDRDYLSLTYGNQAFLTRRSRLDLRFDNLTDGHAGSWQFGLPFYESTTPRSFVTYGAAADHRIVIYRAGIMAEEWRRRAFTAGVVAGVATSAAPAGYTRLLLRAGVRREDYAPDSAAAAMDRSVFGLVGLVLETARVRWAIRQGLDSYGRREDVDLSMRASVGVSALPRAFGYAGTHRGAGLAAALQAGREWPRLLVVAGAQAHGVVGGGMLDSGRVSGRVTAVAFAPRQAILFAAHAAAADGVAPGGEYDLWLQRTGPRLFGAHAFSGTRVYAATLEDRVLLTEELIGLLSVGVAPFVDVGGAWYPGDGRLHGGNAGIALRFGPTRAASGEVLELAGGWRWSSDRSTGGWAVSFGTAYRFFTR